MDKVGICKNKIKQKMIISKLKKIEKIHKKWMNITFSKARENYYNNLKEDSIEIVHSSITYEGFNENKFKKIQELEIEYNHYNEKLPHHLRLQILE